MKLKKTAPIEANLVELELKSLKPISDLATEDREYNVRGLFFAAFDGDRGRVNFFLRQPDINPEVKRFYFDGLPDACTPVNYAESKKHFSIADTIKCHRLCFRLLKNALLEIEKDVALLSDTELLNEVISNIHLNYSHQ